MVFPARLLHEWKRDRFHQTQGEQHVVDELDGGVAFSIPFGLYAKHRGGLPSHYRAVGVNGRRRNCRKDG